MRIIETGEIPHRRVRIRCDVCHTLMEIDMIEDEGIYKKTDMFAMIMHEDLDPYYIGCPVCGKTLYFSND